MKIEADEVKNASKLNFVEFLKGCKQHSFVKQSFSRRNRRLYFASALSNGRVNFSITFAR